MSGPSGQNQEKTGKSAEIVSSKKADPKKQPAPMVDPEQYGWTGKAWDEDSALYRRLDYINTYKVSVPLFDYLRVNKSIALII